MSAPSRVKAWAAFVAAWTGTGVAAALYLEAGEARILVPVVAAFVVVAALWRPFPRSGTVSALVMTGVFAGIRYAVEGTSGIAQVSLAAGIALLLLGMLSDSLSSRADADALQRRHDGLLIDELTPTAETGAMKWQHAQKQLADEVARARRYKYPVSLVLMGLDPVIEHADEGTAEAAVRQRSGLVRLLLQRTRASDRVSFRGADQLALVLPHTPSTGAVAFLDKNLPDIKVAAGTDPRIGVAEFPADAGSAEDLVAEAESALEFGRSSGMRIVSRALLLAQDATPSGRPASAGAAQGVQRSQQQVTRR